MKRCFFVDFNWQLIIELLIFIIRFSNMYLKNKLPNKSATKQLKKKRSG